MCRCMFRYAVHVDSSGPVAMSINNIRLSTVWSASPSPIFITCMHIQTHNFTSVFVRTFKGVIYYPPPNHPQLLPDTYPNPNLNPSPKPNQVHLNPTGLRSSNNPHFASRINILVVNMQHVQEHTQNTHTYAHRQTHTHTFNYVNMYVFNLCVTAFCDSVLN